MKEGYRGHDCYKWHDVCGNCKFYDYTQTVHHCCRIHIHSRLYHENYECGQFIYHEEEEQPFADKMTMDEIKEIADYEESIIEGSLIGETGIPNDLRVSLGKDGIITIGTNEYKLRLHVDSMFFLRELINEGFKRQYERLKR